MRLWVAIVLLLSGLAPAYGQDEEGGMRHELMMATGLRYTDNPAFDGQGDANWATLASLRYVMTTETRRQKLRFSIEGDAIGARVARAEGRLSYQIRSASAKTRLTAFARRVGGGYLDQFPQEGSMRRLVDLSEPGRDITSFGTAGQIETGIGKPTGFRFSYRALFRERSGAAAIAISKSRRFETRAGVILRPSRRMAVTADVGILRQRFSGSAARDDRHVTTALGLRAELTRRLSFEGDAGWRRIRSDAGGVRTERSGLEWSAALKQDHGAMIASARADQRQYLTGTVRSLRFGLESKPTDDARDRLRWSVWVGGLDLPGSGSEAIYGLEASIERENSRLGLTMSRDYLAGLTDGLERMATFARVTYQADLTARHRLDIWAELAEVDGTAVSPARRVAAVEASILTQITPAFSLRSGVTVRNRKGGLSGAARDRSVFLTLERLRMAKR